MKLWSQYVVAKSVDEAVQALASASGPACPVGGGTDLLLELQQGHHAPMDTLVDLTAIDELRCLEERGGRLFIGAGVPVSKVVEHPLVRKHAPGVVEACSLIGGPQVRNSATLGGNVAHALPAADGMISLVAMGAEVEVAAPEGRRMAPILTLFKGPGQSTLIPNREILVGFTLPLRQPGEASAFSRVMRPQGVALPILNMAVWLAREGETIRAARVAVGPAGPTPQRATAVEEYLAGKPFTPQTLEGAVQRMRETMKFRTSARRATSEYRTHLSGVLLQDVLEKAWARSAGPEVM